LSFAFSSTILPPEIGKFELAFYRGEEPKKMINYKDCVVVKSKGFCAETFDYNL
jgi:hypothetical protein